MQSLNLRLPLCTVCYKGRAANKFGEPEELIQCANCSRTSELLFNVSPCVLSSASSFFTLPLFLLPTSLLPFSSPSMFLFVLSISLPFCLYLTLTASILILFRFSLPTFSILLSSLSPHPMKIIRTVQLE